MYYSSGNYEAFARPRKPEGVEHKHAYLVGAGLASLAAAGRTRVRILGGQLRGLTQAAVGPEAEVHLIPTGPRTFQLTGHLSRLAGGADIHWSRLVDLPIAAIILIVKPLLGGRIAEQAAVAKISAPASRPRPRALRIAFFVPLSIQARCIRARCSSSDFRDA